MKHEHELIGKSEETTHFSRKIVGAIFLALLIGCAYFGLSLSHHTDNKLAQTSLKNDLSNYDYQSLKEHAQVLLGNSYQIPIKSNQIDVEQILTDFEDHMKYMQNSRQISEDFTNLGLNGSCIYFPIHFGSSCGPNGGFNEVFPSTIEFHYFNWESGFKTRQVSFEQACNWHDLCYGRCDLSWRQCDEIVRTDFLNECDKQLKGMNECLTICQAATDFSQLTLLIAAGTYYCRDAAELNSQYYLVTKSPKNFQNGNNFCNATFNTSLATIQSENQKNSALSLIKSAGISSAYIGLKRSDYQWLFSENNSSASKCYTNWGPGQPGNDKCVYMASDGKYYDTSCDSQLHFLCDRPIHVPDKC